MPALKSCPSLEALSDFLLGKLDEAARESVAGHVGSCDSCLSRLDQVDQSPDSLVESLRQPPVDDEFLQEPECQLAVERSQKLAPGFAEKTDILRDYELVEKLGEGGMGTVYRALHKKLDKWVAVKLLPAERLHSPEAVSRFHREMRAIGRLHHPNIVQAHDAGEAEGQHYLVMELVEGVDLSTLVRRLGPLSIADACEIVRQVALGLAHAHESDLVHRDIKPSNVMLTAGGEVKILDLGLARLEEPLAREHEVTSTGQIMGTLDYMAPEQLGDSHAVDHRADIYSLGATLYKLLTGQAPYADQSYNTPQKKLMAIATKPIESAVDLRADIPRRLAGVLNRMLSKNPDERFASASEIATALAEFTANADLPSLFTQASQSPDLEAHTKRVVNSTFDPVASSFTDTDPTVSVAEPQAASSPRAKWRQPPWVIAIALSFVIVAAALTVFYIRSGKATLVVEVDDEQVAVELQKHGLIVRDKKTGHSYTISTAGERKLTPGVYVIEPGRQLVVTDDAGLHIETKEFKLVRGGRKVVSVRLELAPTAPVDQSEDVEAETPGSGDTGEPISRMALVTRPLKIEGVKSWSIETVAVRGRIWSPSTPLAIGPDDEFFAVAAREGVIRVYEIENGHLAHALPVHDAPVVAVAWSADQQFLASLGEDGRVVILDHPSGRIVASDRISYAKCLAWHPKQPRLIIGGEKLSSWTPDGWLPNPQNPLGDLVVALSWSPEGDSLAAGAANSGNIYLLNREFETLKVLRDEHRHQVSKLSWSSDGQYLAASTHGQGPQIWRVADDELIRTSEQISAGCGVTFVEGVAFGPDSRTFAFGCIQESLPFVALTSIEDDGGLQKGLYLKDQNQCVSVQWLRDGESVIAVVDTGRICVFDLPSGGLRYQIAPSQASPNAVSPDGRGLVWTHKSNDSAWGHPHIALWDLKTGLTWISEAEIPTALMGGTNTYRWSPDGRFFATWKPGVPTATVVQDGQLVTRIEPQDPIVDAAWSKDGMQLAIASGQRVDIWSIATGTADQSYENQEAISAIAWSPTETIVFGTAAGNLHLWNLDDKEARVVFTQYDGKSVVRLAVSPDGRYVGCCFADTSHVRVFDATSGRLTRTLPMTEPQMDLCWLNSGQQLTCASWSGKTTIWDMDGKKMIPTGKFQSPVRGRPLLSPSERLTGSSRGTAVWLWGHGTGSPLASLAGLRGGRIIQISPEGHYMASADVKDEIVYAVELESGERLTLTQDEFEARFGWKNDPDKSRIILE